MTEDKIRFIAQVCHEVNKAYCESIGDSSQHSWGEAEEWQKVSAVNGVKFTLNGASPESIHDNWINDKINDGWVYGEIKDADRKTHPCIMPYKELSEEQKYKDKLFITTVKAFKDI